MSESPRQETSSDAVRWRVDAAVHPVVRDLAQLRSFMAPQWRERAVPGPERFQYLGPMGDNSVEAQQDDGLAGSDIGHLVELLFTRERFDAAILIPTGVGLLPNRFHGTAVAEAMNRWLAETILSRPDAKGRMFGSIRIDPRDTDGAIREIRRWADYPGMVQAVVPLQAHLPYGHSSYHPIWRELVDRGLPLALRLDSGGSAEFHPSAAGGLQYAIDYDVLAPLNYAYHLASLVAEGVFERLPDLRVVVTDGGWPTLPAFAWRLDKDWLPNRADLPWIRHRPSHYLLNQVLFCLDHLDLGPPDTQSEPWATLAGGGCRLMFASHYPRWGSSHGAEDLARIPASRAAEVCGAAAVELYRLDLPDTSGVVANARSSGDSS